MKRAILAFGIFLVIAAVVAIGWIAFTLYRVSEGFSELAEDVWSEENRIMRSEHFSPDSLHKVGVYHYDAGAFGYTTENVSLVKGNQPYPIRGNLTIANGMGLDSVEWHNSREVLFYVYSPEKSQSLPTPEPDRQGDVLIRYKQRGEKQ